ncbi:Hsp70 family protein, partial [Streptomyces sp. NPDC059697]|uniref:Hsp70 family protein n=1 Tax=Streptomyces sp. NPDC059697 TaxID=3346912 RepID=UPI00369E9BD6
QTITISEGSNLDQGEVERMVQEAEQHRGEDQALREAVDARNELDAVAYQVEKRLAELGDAAPAHEKARAEMLVSDARAAVKEEAGVERVRPLTSELQQVLAGLAAHQGAAATGGPGQDAATGGPTSGGGGVDDVIDAEFDKG